MKKSWLCLSVFTLIILLFFSFSCKNQVKEEAAEENPEERAVVEEKSQISSPVKVVCAKLTKNYTWSKITPSSQKQPDGSTLLTFNSEIMSTKANEQEGNIVLVLRIKGISIDKFEMLAKEDKIYVTNDDTQHILTDYDTRDKTEIGSTVISPWIVCTFIIPQNVTKMELVVGDYPPVEFEAESELFESLEDQDLM